VCRDVFLFARMSPASSTWSLADWQAFHDERAAILEFDGGLGRADAEARALAEIYERLREVAAARGDLLGELITADRRRRHPDLVPVLADLGLDRGRLPAWGVGSIVVEGETWRPASAGERGEASLIVPAFETAGLIDLVAQRLSDGRLYCRLGLATLLGADAVDRARETNAGLMVFRDVASWLAGHGLGAVILDWRDVGRRLEGVRTILCPTRSAPALHRATRLCRPLPLIAVPRPKEIDHAA
jgi:hypothetical protein